MQQQLNEVKRMQELAGVVSEVKVKTNKPEDSQFILRDLANAYGQGIADDQITDEFKKYTVGQIKDDSIRLKGNVREDINQPVADPAKTSDVKNIVKYIETKKDFISRLERVSNGQEVTEFLSFILNKINPKVSGVNKNALMNIIKDRFK